MSDANMSSASATATRASDVGNLSTMESLGFFLDDLSAVCHSGSMLVASIKQLLPKAEGPFGDQSGLSEIEVGLVKKDENPADFVKNDNILLYNKLLAASNDLNVSMILINQLAAQNNIQRCYKLLNKNGPSRGNRVTVSLRLGNEVHQASGPEVNSASRNAALSALKTTNYRFIKPSSNQLVDQKQEDLNGEDAYKSINQVVDLLSSVLHGFKRMEKKSSYVHDHSKNPIIVLDEITSKQKLLVRFTLPSQSGPQNSPIFLTRCVIGQLVTDGIGPSKKLSKERAAESMLGKLHEFGFLK